MLQASFFFARLQAVANLPTLGAAFENEFTKCRLVGLGLFDVGCDPVRHLAIGDRVYLTTSMNCSAATPRGLEPRAIETVPVKFSPVIGMQFPRQMQADFIDKPRQINPAAHRLARTARINYVVHARIILPPLRFLSANISRSTLVDLLHSSHRLRHSCETETIPGSLLEEHVKPEGVRNTSSTHE